MLYQDENESYHSILETDGETAEWVDQYQEIREKGYLGEFSIAGGTNYKDKLYLGAVLGIQWTYDKQRILYSEIAEENAPSLLDFYEFRQYRRTRGTGINLKLGLIYRPVPAIRLGAAIHLPTWFTMEYTLEILFILILLRLPILPSDGINRSMKYPIGLMEPIMILIGIWLMYGLPGERFFVGDLCWGNT